MALVDEVAAAYGTPALVQLTNTATSATVVDTTRLALAASHAERFFLVNAGSTFDITDVAHVAYAVEGVALVLALWKREAKAEKNLAEWKNRLRTELALVGHNNRVTPRGNSRLEIEADAENRTKPDFGPEFFNELAPGGVPGGDRPYAPPGTDPP